jgi:methionyl-tRNA formyltransferase
VESLDRSPEFREQPDEGVTIAPKIGPEDRRLEPALGATVLERRVRALNPHIGAFADTPDGERLGVRRAALSEGTGVAAGALTARDGRLLLGTADGALELLDVVPAGARPMAASAYLRGRGARLAEAG